MPYLYLGVKFFLICHVFLKYVKFLKKQNEYIGYIIF